MNLTITYVNKEEHDVKIWFIENTESLLNCIVKKGETHVLEDVNQIVQIEHVFPKKSDKFTNEGPDGLLRDFYFALAIDDPIRAKIEEFMKTGK